MRILYFLIFCTFLSCNAKENSQFTSIDDDMENTILIGSQVNFAPKKIIERNDIIVFKSENSDALTCLRVVGKPGEKIEIINGEIFINNGKYKFPKTSKTVYAVYAKNESAFSTLQPYNFRRYSSTYGIIDITDEEYSKILREKKVDSIYPLTPAPTLILPEIVKTQTSQHFNTFFFGPVFIPKISDTLSIYDRMLVANSLEPEKKYTPSLICTEEYYFCLGDNFGNSKDSRFIGLISNSQILGVVTKIIQGKTKTIQL